MFLKLMEILWVMVTIWMGSTKLSGRDSFGGADFVHFAETHSNHMAVT